MNKDAFVKEFLGTRGHKEMAEIIDNELDTLHAKIKKSEDPNELKELMRTLQILILTREYIECNVILDNHPTVPFTEKVQGTILNIVNTVKNW